MNKLNKEFIDYLVNLSNVCNLCDIEDIAIEKTIVRGHSSDAKRGIFIMEYDNIPTLDDFDGLGINGIKTLKNRMSIVDESSPSIQYDLKVKDNGDKIIKKLSFHNKKTKIDFTCQDPIHIKSPRNIKDPDVYSFSLTEETVKIMNKIKNMVAGVEEISFNTEKDGSIKFIVTDDKGDIFDHTIAESYNILNTEEAKPHFYHSYNIKYVYPLFKAAMDLQGTSEVILSTRGIIKLIVKGITVRIVAEK